MGQEDSARSENHRFIYVETYGFDDLLSHNLMWADIHPALLPHLRESELPLSDLTQYDLLQIRRIRGLVYRITEGACPECSALSDMLRVQYGCFICTACGHSEC